MHRFIAHLLIISVLAINVVWAMDDCPLQYSNEISGLVVLSGDNQNDGVYDVPCIGWLHLVAITPVTKSFNYFPFTRQKVVQTDTSFHSLDQVPLTRPPQI